MDYQKRRKQLQSFVSSSKIEGLFITDFYNILYLTGFATLSPHEKEAKLLVTPDTVSFVTDTRYETEAKDYLSDSADVQILIQKPELPFLTIIKNWIKQKNIKKLGFEAHDLSYSWYEYLQQSLPQTQLKGLRNIVMNLRNTKDAEELDLMRKAAFLTDDCLKYAVSFIKTGVHEREMCVAMEQWIRSKNLEFAFDPIVAFDSHTALPHYNNKTSDGILKKNSIILIDMGIRYRNYCSDITRVLFHGVPTTEQRNAYNDLLNIQKQTIESLQLHIRMEEIDTVARQGLIDRGYPTIPHSTGHGVGLEVHEGIRVARTVTEKLQDNMVVTIEPGIYYEGKWGMRIEDTVACIDGKAEILTKFDKKLSISPKRNQKHDL